jgi:hypothetical protein
MFSVSVRHFRIICAVALLLLALTQLPVLGLTHFSEGVTNARMWRYFEATAPYWVLFVYPLAVLALFLIGLVGMINFWPVSRWCLAIALVGSLAVRPFFGLTVYSPYEGFISSALGLSGTWLVTVSFWSPLAQHFRGTRSGRVVP